MKLATLVAAALGLAHDAAEETIATKLEETMLSLAKASGAQTLGGALDMLKTASAEVDTLRLAHEAEKQRANGAVAKLEAIETARRAAETKAMVDDAVKSGRLTPASREKFEALVAKHGSEWAKDALEMMPVQQVPDAPPPKGPEVTTTKLDAELKEALEYFGVSEQDHAEARKRGHV